jgi:2-dehydropantoate 2-reductase
MKILVYGAGVVGTVYAALLKLSGHDVTVLARGRRLEEIRQNGLAIEDLASRRRLFVAVDAVERIGDGDRYDLGIVAVRREQLASATPELEANRNIATLVFMVNNPLGASELTRLLGNRALLGFPGVGGTREGHIVRYVMIAQQPTMLGEPDGKRSERLQMAAQAFQAAGFKVQIANDPDGWLRAHAFFVTAIAGAIYLAGGTKQLAAQDATLRLMVSGVREGFAAVRRLGHTITPFGLRVIFTWMPAAYAVRYWRRFFAADMADFVFGRHSAAASEEMRELAKDCRSMLEKAGARADALEQLYGAVDEYAAKHASK